MNHVSGSTCDLSPSINHASCPPCGRARKYEVFVGQSVSHTSERTSAADPTTATGAISLLMPDADVAERLAGQSQAAEVRSYEKESKPSPFQVASVQRSGASAACRRRGPAGPSHWAIRSGCDRSWPGVSARSLLDKLCLLSTVSALGGQDAAAAGSWQCRHRPARQRRPHVCQHSQSPASDFELSVTASTDRGLPCACGCSWSRLRFRQVERRGGIRSSSGSSAVQQNARRTDVRGVCDRPHQHRSVGRG